MVVVGEVPIKALARSVVVMLSFQRIGPFLTCSGELPVHGSFRVGGVRRRRSACLFRWTDSCEET